VKRRLLDLRIGSDPHELKRVRALVREVLDGAGCAERIARDVVIAMNEACMNIMQHAYKGAASGAIVIQIDEDDGEFEFHLQDFAAPVNCAMIKPRPLEQLRPGGLGTHFIREIMDECHYGNMAGGAGNFLRMKKRIAPPAGGRRPGDAI
jgi:sigma-B regulation protein RsbU (phosphoserine phosphatase)